MVYACATLAAALYFDPQIHGPYLRVVLISTGSVTCAGWAVVERVDGGPPLEQCRAGLLRRQNRTSLWAVLPVGGRPELDSRHLHELALVGPAVARGPAAGDTVDNGRLLPVYLTLQCTRRTATRRGRFRRAFAPCWSWPHLPASGRGLDTLPAYLTRSFAAPAACNWLFRQPRNQPRIWNRPISRLAWLVPTLPLRTSSACLRVLTNPMQ